VSLPFTVQAAAENDIAAARDWYDSHQAGLGTQFLLAVERAFDHIQNWPESFPAEYRDVRRVGLKRFPYVVYYQITVRGIEVLGVLHGSRDPRAWKARA
jgi:plasmid stabilization system protein ParE